MLNLPAASSTNENNTNTCNLQSIHVAIIKTPPTRSITSCLHIGRKKLMWIIFAYIVAIVIIAAITIPIITVTKTKPENITTEWIQDGITVAGGYGPGELLYHVAEPHGLHINDDDQLLYVVDTGNHRVVEWKYGSSRGQIVAGSYKQGNRMNELHKPLDVVIEENNDSLIICDHLNKRVVRWPRQKGKKGQTLISNIACYGLAMDNNGDLYIADVSRSVVKRWINGYKKGIIVAGGNGQGSGLHQLDWPTYIFVDQNYTVYVADYYNHRVMKWTNNATSGIVVAGGEGQGDNLTQLNGPRGIVVDHLDSVYVADHNNHRIVRWTKDSTEGSIVIGGNGLGSEANQFDHPEDISFDRKYNLYVADTGNDRIQKFLLNPN